MYLIVQMHFMHALRSGAVVRLAVRYAPTAVLRWIVEQGGAVNGVGVDRPSALAFAVLNKNASKVAVLLAAGADVHTTGYPQDTPLLCLCPNWNLYPVYDEDPQAVPADISIVGLLLDAGADVNARNSASQTLLCRIIQKRKVDTFEPIIYMLLDAGGDALTDHLPYAINLLSTHIPRPGLADMLLGVIAYQAHLAQYIVPMIEQPNRRIAISQAILTLRKPEVLVHAHAAMRRQAWSRRRGAVVSWHVLAHESE
jgi:hypothetical protein